MSEFRDDPTATLEAMGEQKVKLLIQSGMLVHHLQVPANEWLLRKAAERQAKGAPHATDEGQQ